MRTVDRRLGLTLVFALGCTFDSGNANDSSQLGSSAGESDPNPTSASSTGDDTAGSGGAEGSTSVAGSTSVGSEESCVDTCIPQVPAGWTGPYYIADVANPIDCPPGYDTQDLAYSGLVAPDAECACSCSSSPGSCEIEFLLSVTGCLTGPEPQLGDGGCTSLNAAGFDVHARATMSGSPMTCSPNTEVLVEPAQWNTASTFCAAPARGGDCGGDRCTAPPPEGVSTRLCIAKDGDTSCPGGGYDQRAVLHRDVDDQRTCEGCNCAGPPECTGQAFAHDDGSCNDSPQDVPLNSCVDIDVSGTYSVSASIDAGSCTATDASPAGAAIPIDPVTICCVTP